MIFDSIYFNCSYARTLLYINLMILLSLHAFIYISNSHSHSHFYIRGHLLLLLLLLSPHNPFTFKILLYLFTLLPLNCVPTQPLLHRDAIFRTSRRSHRYVGTQFQMHREEVKNIRMQAAIPRDSLSDSSNIFLSYTGLLIFCPCVRQQYKM